MLDKTFDARAVEETIYAAWEAGGAFAPKGEGVPYAIMLPPPNVTGSLHIGHALDHTLQDVLIRYHRMRGRKTLWQPGTDHAGIATQMMVERKLAEEGKERRGIGREAFLDEVWRFKAASGGTIQRQMRRLGQSPDWSRERFTMDEGLSKAVLRAFVRLHADGLIYRDKRLVNWDVRLQTAVSDLETEQREVDGHLWHLDYPIEGTDRVLTVATTRPETMLGDTGVAVHPDDERYKDVVGRHVVLPLVGRRIPIVADAYSDPEKGTGAVKITPAHDFNDFEVGKRHGLEALAILDEAGRVNDDAPARYRGLERFEARRQVLIDLEAEGRLRLTEPHRHAVPHGDRSGTPLEPYLTDQWYCDAGRLAGPAIGAVEDGRTRFVPAQWANTYFEWLRNIQPWCISRQLWWGHRIPAWYGPDGTIFVAEDEAGAIEQARRHYGEDRDLTRDPDVLDTWFSSGLWPFSTLGWPDRTEDLATFYPTDALVTGFDIIFFWVARMMMLGLYLTGETPFKDVCIHGLVRDEKGQKMSKTRGNVVDPLTLADRYGADALRLSLVSATVQGRDAKFGAARVETYRNFVTKLWNAARFVEMNGGGKFGGFDPAGVTLPVNRWIVTALQKTAAEVAGAIEAYRFNEAVLHLYQFVWDDYCDWYIELIKPTLSGDDDAAAETRGTASWVLAETLKLLHPMAPFVSEVLWRDLFGAPGGMLIDAAWPTPRPDLVDAGAEADLGWLIETVSGVRAARSEVNVPASARLTLDVHGGDQALVDRLARHRASLLRLARLDDVRGSHGPVPRTAIAVVQGDAVLAMDVGGIVDFDAEAKRLRKEADKAASDLDKTRRRLADPNFVARAPAEVVEENRERVALTATRLERLEAALARIAQA